MGKSSSSSSEEEKKEDKKEKKEKKVKKVKPKLVYVTPQGFSKRYAHLFNNKQYSDVTVNYPGGDSHPAHKAILCSGSLEIEKKLEEAGHFTFDKQTDDTIAKSLIQFLYSGSLEYSNESSLVQFMILANHLKVRNITEFKVPAKVYLNGVVNYVEQDLTNRIGEFDSLAESVDFKKVEKEDLTKLYSKKKWLQKSSTFLNHIILKDMEDSDEEGSKDSDGSKSSKSGSDSESEKESEESEEDEEEGGIPKFLPKKSAPNAFKFTKKNRECTTLTNSYWAANVIATKTTKYALKFGSKCNDLMIGFAPDTVNVSQSNYTSCGWYFYTTPGSLYSQDGDSSRAFTTADYSTGVVYGFELNVKKGTITIYKNNKSLGLAYTLKDKKIAKKCIPCINCYYDQQSFEFVKFKKKK